MYILFMLATKDPRALIEVIKTASFLQSEYESLFQEDEIHLSSSLFSGIMHYLMVFLSLSLPSILLKFHVLLFKLLKDSPNLNTYKYFFTNRVTNLWNQLPSDMVNASSVNCFKNKIDRLLQTYTFQTKIDIYDMKITAEA